MFLYGEPLLGRGCARRDGFVMEIVCGGACENNGLALSLAVRATEFYMHHFCKSA